MSRTVYFAFILFFGLLSHASAQDTIGILLNPAAPGRTISPDFAGLSFEKNSLNKEYFSPHKDTLIRFFHTLGLKSIRVGGNSVDRDTLSATPTATRFTKSELDSLFGFIQQTQCKAIIGLNFGGDFNPSQAATEVSYILQHYSPLVFGFEIGNEPDLYYSNGFRPANYTVASYEAQYKQYRDTILKTNPAAVFTGPASASHYTTFTEPFCRNMKGESSLLTQHYYAGAANSAPVRKQTVTLLSASKLNAVVSEANALVHCADSSAIPFRMGECNSFYNGGQWGVSDAFSSALWALDYMYALASAGCSGVNFHGALSGPYTAIAYHNRLYSARPLYYGILAFQTGSKGKFITETVTNNHINLNAYSVLDSSGTEYITIINKDTLQDAFVNLDAGSVVYTAASLINLTAPALDDTLHTLLGGQTVNPDGTCAPYVWLNLTVTNHKTQFELGAGSAAIVRFLPQNTNGIAVADGNGKSSIFPNPSDGIIFLKTENILPEGSFAELFDISGRRLSLASVFGKLNRLDFTETKPGLYLLRVVSEGAILFQTKVLIR